LTGRAHNFVCLVLSPTAVEERFSKKEGNLKKFRPVVIKAGAILLKVLDKPRQDD